MKPLSLSVNETFRGRTRFFILYIAFQAFCHVSALLLFKYNQPAFDIPDSFQYQFYFGGLILFAVSIITTVVKKPGTIALLISLGLFISLVLGYPLNQHIGIEILHSVSLIAAVSMLLSESWKHYLSLGIIAATLFFQRPSLSWGRSIESPDSMELVLLAGSLFITYFLFRTLQKYIGLQHKQNEDIAQLEDTIKRLTKANIGFQDYTAVIEEQSRTNERNRITRELHDVVGYTLTNITMMMEEGIDLYKDTNFEELLSVVVTTRDQARQGHTDIREALKKLRTIDSQENYFFSTIDKMITTFQNATGLKIHIEYTNFPLHVDDSTGACIIRLIQEGMTNAVRHGKATDATVFLSRDEDELVISVRDNGKGCEFLQEGLGITGMRERLQQMGGSISFHSSIGGFQFIARMPCSHQTGKRR